MSLWTHYMCMTTNPGYIPEIKDIDIVEIDMIFTHCSKCDSYRPIGSHHCKTCKRCILRMDHHCVWVCNCVGKFNQKFFMQYLSYIIVMAFFDLLLILINIRDFLSYSGKNNKYQMYYIIKRSPYLIVIYGSIAMVFLLFGAIMLIDQLVTVFRNRTGIDSLQKIKFQRLKFRESLKNIFGNTCSEVFLPIKNEKDKYWGKELTLMDIVAIMSLDEFKLEEDQRENNSTMLTNKMEYEDTNKSDQKESEMEIKMCLKSFIYFKKFLENVKNKPQKLVTAVLSNDQLLQNVLNMTEIMSYSGTGKNGRYGGEYSTNIDVDEVNIVKKYVTNHSVPLPLLPNKIFVNATEVVSSMNKYSAGGDLKTYKNKIYELEAGVYWEILNLFKVIKLNRNFYIEYDRNLPLNYREEGKLRFFEDDELFYELLETVKSELTSYFESVNELCNYSLENNCTLLTKLVQNHLLEFLNKLFIQYQGVHNYLTFFYNVVNMGKDPDWFDHYSDLLVKILENLICLHYISNVYTKEQFEEYFMFFSSSNNSLLSNTKLIILQDVLLSLHAYNNPGSNTLTNNTYMLLSLLSNNRIGMDVLINYMDIVMVTRNNIVKLITLNVYHTYVSDGSKYMKTPNSSTSNADLMTSSRPSEEEDGDMYINLYVIRNQLLTKVLNYYATNNLMIYLHLMTNYVLPNAKARAVEVPGANGGNGTPGDDLEDREEIYSHALSLLFEPITNVTAPSNTHGAGQIHSTHNVNVQNEQNQQTTQTPGMGTGQQGMGTGQQGMGTGQQGLVTGQQGLATVQPGGTNCMLKRLMTMLTYYKNELKTNKKLNMKLLYTVLLLFSKLSRLNRNFYTILQLQYMNMNNDEKAELDNGVKLIDMLLGLYEILNGNKYYKLATLLLDVLNFFFAPYSPRRTFKSTYNYVKEGDLARKLMSNRDGLLIRLLHNFKPTMSMASDVESFKRYTAFYRQLFSNYNANSNYKGLMETKIDCFYKFLIYDFNDHLKTDDASLMEEMYQNLYCIFTLLSKTVYGGGNETLPEVTIGAPTQVSPGTNNPGPGQVGQPGTLAQLGQLGQPGTSADHVASATLGGPGLLSSGTTGRGFIPGGTSGRGLVPIGTANPGLVPSGGNEGGYLTVGTSGSTAFEDSSSVGPNIASFTSGGSSSGTAGGYLKGSRNLGLLTGGRTGASGVQTGGSEGNVIGRASTNNMLSGVSGSSMSSASGFSNVPTGLTPVGGVSNAPSGLSNGTTSTVGNVGSNSLSHGNRGNVGSSSLSHGNSGNIGSSVYAGAGIAGHTAAGSHVPSGTYTTHASGSTKGLLNELLTSFINNNIFIDLLSLITCNKKNESIAYNQFINYNHLNNKLLHNKRSDTAIVMLELMLGLMARSKNATLVLCHNYGNLFYTTFTRAYKYKYVMNKRELCGFFSEELNLINSLKLLSLNNTRCLSIMLLLTEMYSQHKYNAAMQIINNNPNSNKTILSALMKMNATLLKREDVLEYLVLLNNYNIQMQMQSVNGGVNKSNSWDNALVNRIIYYVITFNYFAYYIYYNPKSQGGLTSGCVSGNMSSSSSSSTTAGSSGSRTGDQDEQVLMCCVKEEDEVVMNYIENNLMNFLNTDDLSDLDRLNYTLKVVNVSCYSTHILRVLNKFLNYINYGYTQITDTQTMRQVYSTLNIVAEKLLVYYYFNLRLLMESNWKQDYYRKIQYNKFIVYQQQSTSAEIIIKLALTFFLSQTRGDGSSSSGTSGSSKYKMTRGGMENGANSVSYGANSRNVNYNAGGSSAPANNLGYSVPGFGSTNSNMSYGSSINSSLGYVMPANPTVAGNLGSSFNNVGGSNASAVSYSNTLSAGSSNMSYGVGANMSFGNWVGDNSISASSNLCYGSSSANVNLCYGSGVSGFNTGVSGSTAGFGNTFGGGMTAGTVSFDGGTMGYSANTGNIGYSANTGNIGYSAGGGNMGFGSSADFSGTSNLGFGEGVSGGTSNMGYGTAGSSYGATSSTFGHASSNNTGFGNIGSNTSGGFGSRGYGTTAGSFGSSGNGNHYGSVASSGNVYGTTTSSYANSNNAYGNNSNSYGNTSNNYANTTSSYGNTSTSYANNNYANTTSNGYSSVIGFGAGSSNANDGYGAASSTYGIGSTGLGHNTGAASEYSLLGTAGTSELEHTRTRSEGRLSHSSSSSSLCLSTSSASSCYSGSASATSSCGYAPTTGSGTSGTSSTNSVAGDIDKKIKWAKSMSKMMELLNDFELRLKLNDNARYVLLNYLNMYMTDVYTGADMGGKTTNVSGEVDTRSMHTLSELYSRREVEEYLSYLYKLYNAMMFPEGCTYWDCSIDEEMVANTLNMLIKNKKNSDALLLACNLYTLVNSTNIEMFNLLNQLLFNYYHVKERPEHMRPHHKNDHFILLKNGRVANEHYYKTFQALYVLHLNRNVSIYEPQGPGDPSTNDYNVIFKSSEFNEMLRQLQAYDGTYKLSFYKYVMYLLQFLQTLYHKNTDSGKSLAKNMLTGCGGNTIGQKGGAETANTMFSSSKDAGNPLYVSTASTSGQVQGAGGAESISFYTSAGSAESGKTTYSKSAESTKNLYKNMEAANSGGIANIRDSSGIKLTNMLKMLYIFKDYYATVDGPKRSYVIRDEKTNKLIKNHKYELYQQFLKIFASSQFFLEMTGSGSGGSVSDRERLVDTLIGSIYARLKFLFSNGYAEYISGLERTKEEEQKLNEYFGEEILLSVQLFNGSSHVPSVKKTKLLNRLNFYANNSFFTNEQERGLSVKYEIMNNFINIINKFGLAVDLVALVNQMKLMVLTTMSTGGRSVSESSATTMNKKMVSLLFEKLLLLYLYNIDNEAGSAVTEGKGAQARSREDEEARLAERNQQLRTIYMELYKLNIIENSTLQLSKMLN
ncbi:protein S-acyltransferase [Theileria orientalis]|uniref:Protein S-acyltransferase n=1 Tax=Theileria orientalis TaxID=68886 RepID=A0A976MCF3_THEOR|nr:protein S-acyltransferase [Theileria orientalis]